MGNRKEMNPERKTSAGDKEERKRRRSQMRHLERTRRTAGRSEEDKTAKNQTSDAEHWIVLEL